MADCSPGWRRHNQMEAARWRRMRRNDTTKLHDGTLERAHQEREVCRVESGPACLTQENGWKRRAGWVRRAFLASTKNPYKPLPSACTCYTQSSALYLPLPVDAPRLPVGTERVT